MPERLKGITESKNLVPFIRNLAGRRKERNEKGWEQQSLISYIVWVVLIIGAEEYISVHKVNNWLKETTWESKWEAGA